MKKMKNNLKQLILIQNDEKIIQKKCIYIYIKEIKK